MPVKYANFVKIQSISSGKRLRPKVSNLIVILIEPLSLKQFRRESSTLFVHSFFYKNIFYKNVEAEISEILRIF